MADLFEPDDQVLITTIDPNKDYLPELVGDGKKFKDTSALARGKAESDIFIQKLQHDLEEARNEIKQGVNTKDILDQIKALKDAPAQKQEEPLTPPEERKSLTPEELEAFLDRKLTENKTLESQQRNQELVQTALTKHFGSEDIAKSEIARKAKDLDIKPEILRQMAQQSPKAFLALITETSKQKDSTPPKPSLSSAGLTSFIPTGPKTKSTWDDLKKRDPKSYFSREATIERHNNAMKLGEAFFDT